MPDLFGAYHFEDDGAALPQPETEAARLQRLADQESRHVARAAEKDRQREEVDRILHPDLGPRVSLTWQQVLYASGEASLAGWVVERDPGGAMVAWLSEEDHILGLAALAAEIEEGDEDDEDGRTRCRIAYLPVWAAVLECADAMDALPGDDVMVVRFADESFLAIKYGDDGSPVAENMAGGWSAEEARDALS